MKEIGERIQQWWGGQLDRIFEATSEDRPLWERLGAGVVVLTYLTTREVFRDRAPMMAASLSFFTVLAVVPLLTVAASLMAAFGLLEGEGGVVFDTLYRVFPDVASGIAGYLGDVATDNAQAVGGIGAVTLLIIGLVLFNVIEETLTRIWRGAHDRSVVIKMLTFYAMITFGPVLIALSIVQTASAHLYLSQLGIDVSLLDQLLPVAYGLIAFTLLYRLVPNAHVTWRSALVGGLYAAVAFELAKWGFNVYVNQLLLQTYDRVYGALALIPIGLIWVYLSWLVILIGAELSYAFQHLGRLARRGPGGAKNSIAVQARAVHPVVALQVLAPIVEAFQNGAPPVNAKGVAEQMELSAEIVGEILRVWEDEKLILAVGEEEDDEKGYVPSRPPEVMELVQFVDALGNAQLVGPAGRAKETCREYRRASRAFFEGRTAAELCGDTDASKRAEDAKGAAGAAADAVTV